MTRWIAAALLAGLALAACKEAPAPSTANTPGAAAPAGSAAATLSLEAIAEQAQGFSVGPAMSARVVYVFFDAQCPHCAALWDAAKPLRGQARMVWIPVRLLNDASLSQGATLLAAPNPEEAMNAHELSMREKKGGISASGDIGKQKEAVQKNTELFNRYAFASVPTLVTKDASGAVVTREGSMPTDALAAFIGAGAAVQR